MVTKHLHKWCITAYLSGDVTRFAVLVDDTVDVTIEWAKEYLEKNGFVNHGPVVVELGDQFYQSYQAKE